MPFADDIRNFLFASLDTRLVRRKGKVLMEHRCLPTDKHITAMGDFVDAMDLMDTGEKDEDR